MLKFNSDLKSLKKFKSILISVLVLNSFLVISCTGKDGEFYLSKKNDKGIQYYVFGSEIEKVEQEQDIHYNRYTGVTIREVIYTKQVNDKAVTYNGIRIYDNRNVLILEMAPENADISFTTEAWNFDSADTLREFTVQKNRLNLAPVWN